MWNTDLPINQLPDNIRFCYAEEAEFLHYDLRSNKLEVILIPAPEPKHLGHMIRIVENQNPDWYRDLYWSTSYFRRDRSLAALDRIRKEKDRPFRVSPFKYDSAYRCLIHNRLTEGFREKGKEIPPNREVRLYFGLEHAVVDSLEFRNVDPKAAGADNLESIPF